MLAPLCGNFQSACTSNAQCAFNTCVSGFCSGSFSSSATSSTSSMPTSTTTQPSSTSQTATLPLGAVCTPSSTPCANGSQCYAVNSMLILYCGNFQAVCTSNSQCAFNTCVSGFCSGPLSSSVTSSFPTSTSTTTQASYTAPSTTLALGTVCTPSSTPCANGSQCYAVNSMLIPRCGNFQAACSSNSQCAFNTCVNGFCSGALPSSIGSGGLAPTSSSTGNYTAGATTSSRSSATPTYVQASGAGKVIGKFGALAIVVMGAAMLL
jgi:hypothetical protein